MNHRRATPQDRTGRMAEWRRAALSLLRGLAALGIAALVVFGIRSGRNWLLHGERFAIRTITFTGTHRADEADLLRRAGISTGQNIFAVHPLDVDAAMEQAEWVDHVRASRSFTSSTIFINVTERRPAAVVNADGLFVVDPAARRIKALSSADNLDLPVVTGLAPGDFGNADHAATPAGIAAMQVLRSWQSDRMAKIAPLQELHVTTTGGETTYEAWCGDDPTVRVALGSFGSDPTREIGPVLRRLERVWAEVARENRRAQSIDLGNRERAEWVSARLEPIARADGPH